VLPSAFTHALAAFPSDFFSTEASDLATFGRDWTKVYTPNAAGLARPRTSDEVSRLLALCHAHQVAVVPSGGRTGLAGGAVAAKGEVVLSLSRMNKMEAVDTLGATVRVQAGAITQVVHEHAAAHGLTWPVDFASKGSSTVGGNIATNAGGVRVIRYGLTRQWVLGLAVVLADGTVLDLDRALEKNNTGADLRQLFIGSEGTLGVITAATLKLTRPPSRAQVALFAVADLASVLRLFRELRASDVTLAAFEFFTDRCLARLLSHRRLRQPFASPASHYVLVEAEGALDEAWLARVFEQGLAQDGVLAQSSAQAAELWALREGISESLSATGLPHKNDVALPIAALEAFTAELQSLFAARYAGWEICIFGHIGDGNLHINVMKPDALTAEEFWARTHALDADLFAIVQRFGGSISAEHGIGLLKKDFLPFSRTPAELALMRTLKQALDPRGILNPGKIF
jgi:FAD/FMN-containing dehydrogenase